MDWQIVGAVGAFVVVWSAIMLWAVKALLHRLENKLDERSGEWRQVKQELTDLRVQLPERYVQREDWIRFGGSIDAKLDGLHKSIADLRVAHEQRS